MWAVLIDAARALAKPYHFSNNVGPDVPLCMLFWVINYFSPHNLRIGYYYRISKNACTCVTVINEMTYDAAKCAIESIILWIRSLMPGSIGEPILVG